MDNIDDTLPDGAWKDSFDKLLDQRSTLRELNIIKRDVRTSFNLNSSYENSSCDNTASNRPELQMPVVSEFPKIQHLQVPKTKKPKKVKKISKRSDVISTPVKSNLTSNPFKCTLSPIGICDFKYFNETNKLKDNRKTVQFNATTINGSTVVNVDYVEEPSADDRPKYSVDVSPFALVKAKWKSKQTHKQVCFAANTVDEKTTEVAEILVNDFAPQTVNEVPLQPGKWRKSLHTLRRTQFENERNPKTDILHHKGRSTGYVKNPNTSMTLLKNVACTRKSILIKPNTTTKTRNVPRSTYSLGNNDFKSQVLKRCGQRRVLLFDCAYNESYLQNCRKIGEGAFGEVFLYTNHTNENLEMGKNDVKDNTVLKIIPIEGKELINGEVQKTFEQILPEVIISMELCALNKNYRKSNATSGYVHLQRVRYVKGEYPSYLKKLWEEYDLNKESENDHPNCFTNYQQYIILELAFSGQDLEGFSFKNAEQSYYALQQVILTLAVGENEYQFEHRDLHWGNVLVLNTNQQYISYKLDDEELTMPTKGVHITIIDYTLSRLTLNDRCFYNDLSNDAELFVATGDYQFDIYRMMREILNDKWETFEPKTNIFWISYIISKLLKGVSYKNVRSKLHSEYMEKLRQLQTKILSYTSCLDCARDLFSKEN